MYLKCIDAHGTQLEEGRVYETMSENDYLVLPRTGHEYLKGLDRAGYRSDRFVEASNADLVFAINKGHIKME